MVKRIRPDVLAVICLPLVLPACSEEEKEAAPDIRPVRTVTVEQRSTDETLISLTGDIQSRYQADLGFRVSGKIISRPVDVGTAVKTGDLLAQLDPQQYQQDLQAAKADVAAAQAEVTRSQAQEARSRELLKSGNTTQVLYDQALKTFKTAQAQLEAAQAKQTQAQDNVGYTDLKADNDGVITAVGADAGHVVSAGRMVVQLARPEEREAVFNVAALGSRRVPKNPTVDVSLVSNPATKTTGKVRYVSPQADPVTRTYAVRIALDDPPPEMRLGATVTGSVSMLNEKLIQIPSSALFEKDGKPAVWVVDPTNNSVHLQTISVERHESNMAVVSDGLKHGDIVVTAGVRKILPGQKVRLMDVAQK
jgi:membrane fusion protein, multidrug efflux system